MKSSDVSKKIRYLCGWIVVRPVRWFFWRMMWASVGLRTLPERDEFSKKWRYPNPHWWFLYKTVFKFCKWLYLDGWRPFCKWSDRGRKSYPLIARIIHKIGRTTAGQTIMSSECSHCGSEDGCQVDLADDETGTTFKLERTWSDATMEGTDHRFCGTTICPKCGYEAYYEDGSL